MRINRQMAFREYLLLCLSPLHILPMRRRYGLWRLRTLVQCYLVKSLQQPNEHERRFVVCELVMVMISAYEFRRS